MKTKFYLVCFLSVLAGAQKGFAQPIDTLVYTMKYLGNTNPYYERANVVVSDEVYPPTGTYTNFFAPGVEERINVSFLADPAQATITTWSFIVDSASGPQMTFEQDYATDLGANTGLPNVPASSSTYNTVAMFTFPKGVYTAGFFPESEVYFMLNIPKPIVTINNAVAQYCPNDAVQFNAGMWGSEAGLTFNWYFYTSSRSDTTLLTSVSTPAFNLIPSQYPALMSLIGGSTSNQNISFYCIAVGTNSSSSPSLNNTVQFSPPPPSIGSISSTDACPNVPTGAAGTITLQNVVAADSCRYILRNGLNNTSTCDPLNESCLDVAASGTFKASTYTITNVEPGPYTLWVANKGGSAGSCSQTFNVTINAIATLTLGSVSQTNVSCAGSSDGSITVNTSGGQAGTVVCKLLSEPGDVLVKTQSTGIFTNLSAGSYKVSVTDGCNETQQPPVFTITQPTQMMGSYTKTDATCGNPGNGSLTVNVSQGSGTYNYYLYLGGSLVGSQLGSTYSNWEVNNLVGGSYSVQVVDAAAAACSGYTATVTIGALPSLGINTPQVSDLTCNGLPAGGVVLQGVGGTGTYNYSLNDAAIGYSGTNTTGIFAGLAAGSYTAIVQSAVPGCSDSYTYGSAVAVSQPAIIGIGLTATDVSCYGLQNGSVAASLSGGTGALTPVWQSDVAGSWVVVGSNGTTLPGLSPGMYRLSVTDGNGCAALSDPVTITQPLVLGIPSVGMTDIVCYGGNGTITPVSTGGNGGNIFSYSGDGGSTYTPFVPGAAFGVGSYLVEVTDSKGCTASYASPEVITAPPSALNFTDQLSDYNGYNISCYGATNGSVTVTAAGGNGAGYGGYSYGVDGGSFQSSDILSGLPAGQHTIRVEDGRGCVVLQQETLVQPVSELSLTLESQQNNVCANGSAGQLVVTATGGTSPYSYSKDGVTYQDAGTFGGLTTGNYTIEAKDQNGCQLGGSYAIVSLYSALVATSSVQAVGCNGGSDGSITVSVTGGYGAYSYQWSVLQNITSGGGNPVPGAVGPTVTALPAGSYIALVTDDQGCTQADTAVVGQPAVLSAQVAVRPVCSDATGGVVTITATGGTPPYLYSPDGGVTMNTDSTFSGLAAGSYTIGITDSHGCSWNQPVTITTNPLVPTVAFLVSTQQNAMDTLQVEDISNPQPDSVNWSFAPATLLLGSDSVGPLIRYSQAGTYPATEETWYGGCAFSVTQDILIQPFDSSSYNPLVQAGLSFDTVTIAPNPNPGIFNLYVQLYKAQHLMMTITSLAGQMVLSQEWDGQQIVSQQVVLPSSVVSGVYIVELVTDTDVRDYNIIVAK
jgi:hypothetical protein